MRVLPHTVLGAEVILESYADVYSNQFMTGFSFLNIHKENSVQYILHNIKYSVKHSPLYNYSAVSPKMADESGKFLIKR